MSRTYEQFDDVIVWAMYDVMRDVTDDVIDDVIDDEIDVPLAQILTTFYLLFFVYS